MRILEVIRLERRRILPRYAWIGLALWIPTRVILGESGIPQRTLLAFGELTLPLLLLLLSHRGLLPHEGETEVYQATSRPKGLSLAIRLGWLLGWGAMVAVTLSPSLYGVLMVMAPACLLGGLTLLISGWTQAAIGLGVGLGWWGWAAFHLVNPERSLDGHLQALLLGFSYAFSGDGLGMTLKYKGAQLLVGLWGYAGALLVLSRRFR